MAAQKHICIIGAGVIGLQTAVTLLEAGYRVSIIAQHWPQTSMKDGLYTSAWAGAQWRTHAPPNSRAAAWDARTYAHWSTLPPSSGVSRISLTEYRAIPPDPATPWWASLSPSFRHIPASELPAGVASGMTMDSFVADPGVYLLYLLGKVKAMGGRSYLVEKGLPTADGLPGVLSAARSLAQTHSDASHPDSSHPPSHGPPALYINATGLHARAFMPEEAQKLTPIRGQTLLIRGSFPRLITRLGSQPGDVLAVIPRPGTGTTIVGSTRGVGREDLGEDGGETEWLIREGRGVAGGLFEGGEGDGDGDGDGRGDGRGEVLGVGVGLRPRREGGARVELERVGKGGEWVVHAFGHDGAGFQASVGCAEEVRGLVRGWEERGEV